MPSLTSPPPFGRPLTDEKKKMTALWVRWWVENFKGVLGTLDSETAARIAGDLAEQAARIAADAVERAARITADEAHVADLDPHPVYQLRSEREQNAGYAGLDASGKLNGLRQVYGIAAGTACQGNDPRLVAPVLPVLASGVYTPTLFNVFNITSSGALPAQWLRVGNTVNVSGLVGVTPTITAQVTQLGFSLPVPSALAGLQDCSGVAHASSVAGQGAGIYADTTNHRATMQWISTDVANQFMHFILTYQVI